MLAEFAWVLAELFLPRGRLLGFRAPKTMDFGSLTIRSRLEKVFNCGESVEVGSLESSLDRLGKCGT